MEEKVCCPHVVWFPHPSVFRCRGAQEGSGNQTSERPSDGQGHVLLKKYKLNLESSGYKGTGDHTDWSTQEYYY